MRVTPEYKARDAAGYQRHYHNNRYDDWHDFTGLFAVVAGTIAVVGHACTSWHAIVRGRDSAGGTAPAAPAYAPGTGLPGTWPPGIGPFGLEMPGCGIFV